MRRIAVLCALAAFLGCKGEDGELGLKIDLFEKSLSNGLKVIIVEDHSIPLVSYQTWFRVGSVDEVPGKTGLAHLFEHLMFKGTLTSGPKAFFEKLEKRGAEVNATTTRDSTVYYQNFIPVLLEDVIALESDRMRNLRLTDEGLQNEKAVVLEERRLRLENSPEALLQEALWRQVFRVHPYRTPVIGEMEDVVHLELPDLREFYDRYYQPANATVVVVGDVEASATFQKIKSAYGVIPRRDSPARALIAEPDASGERRHVLYTPIESERIGMGFPIVQANHPDSYALDLLASVLFDGVTSRAWKNIVEEKGLAVSLAGAAFTPLYPGMFWINGVARGRITGETLEENITRVLDEIASGKKPPTEAEVKRATRQLTVEMVDSVRTFFGLGQLIGTVDSTLGDPARFRKDIAKYFDVTPEDVVRVAKKYFEVNRRSVVILKKKEGT